MADVTDATTDCVAQLKKMRQNLFLCFTKGDIAGWDCSKQRSYALGHANKYIELKKIVDVTVDTNKSLVEDIDYLFDRFNVDLSAR